MKTKKEPKKFTKKAARRFINDHLPAGLKRAILLDIVGQAFTVGQARSSAPLKPVHTTPKKIRDRIGHKMQHLEPKLMECLSEGLVGFDAATGNYYIGEAQVRKLPSLTTIESQRAERKRKKDAERSRKRYQDQLERDRQLIELKQEKTREASLMSAFRKVVDELLERQQVEQQVQAEQSVIQPVIETELVGAI